MEGFPPGKGPKCCGIRVLGEKNPIFHELNTRQIAMSLQVHFLPCLRQVLSCSTGGAKAQYVD